MYIHYENFIILFHCNKNIVMFEYNNNNTIIIGLIESFPFYDKNIFIINHIYPYPYSQSSQFSFFIHNY